jgi:uncharacterized membrane protein
MVSIGGYSLRGAAMSNPEQQIARLQMQLKTLHKSVQKLIKLMAETSDPKVLETLTVQMQQLRMMIETIQAQIQQIQFNEQAKEAARERNQRLHEEAMDKK